ncbi:Transmembrane protein 68 [Armadillidium nasatum]|uniref:Transmembrane protein 68 n=1 Tax=Armadillidium nasatum TaxID=96803 RepID=A0A5N5SLM8_9CRUS|nr:Transmembrane protein 68 [Armadillidium nasatum]
MKTSSLRVSKYHNLQANDHKSLGYEIKGLENLPQEGGCIVVYYHGALPVDVYYFTSRVILRRGRMIRNIGDRFLAKIPGWRSLLDAYSIKPGTVSSCIEDVKEGHVLAISPGGVREAQFSNHHYQLLWGKRTGFAKVSQETGCPIIPMFTQNVREAFRTFCWPQKFWVYIYEKLKLPFAPVYGGFPVKRVNVFLSQEIPSYF